MSLPIATLSCDQCRLRKVKCDKAVPCSACVAAGIDCVAVQRQRRPRGRTGKLHSSVTSNAGGNDISKQSLAQRIAQLEATVEQLRVLNKSNEGSNNGSYQVSPMVTTSTMPYLGASFWTELSDTFSEIKDVLEPEADQITFPVQDTADNKPGLSTGSSIPSTHSILFNISTSCSTTTTLHLDYWQDWLLDVYKSRVDTIFRVVYMPLLPDPNKCHTGSAGLDKMRLEARALRAAMCFTAICSLADDEFEQRRMLAQHYKSAAELAMHQVDLLTTTSIVVLQAFVVYLAGLRALEADAQQWTLIATAVRLANAQNIPSSLHRSPTSLETELKRRLWMAIGVLDLQSSMDRATQPLLKASDLQDLHSDFYDCAVIPNLIDSHYLDFSEMCFVLTIHRAGVCQRRLSEIGVAASHTTDTRLYSKLLQERETTIAMFKVSVQQMIEQFGISRSPLQNFTVAVAEESLMSIQLLLRRPLHRTNYSVAVSQEKTIINENFDILGTALAILKRSLNKRTQHEYLRWQWFLWPKWYALAIVLAEFCSNRVERERIPHAWDVAQQSFNDYAELVADSKTGLLWKPIAKLMHGALAVRNEQWPPDLPTKLGNRHLDKIHTAGLQAPSQTFLNNEDEISQSNKSAVCENEHRDSSWFEDVTPGAVDVLPDAWQTLLDGLYDADATTWFEF